MLPVQEQTNTPIKENFFQLRDAIFQRRPILHDIIKKHGTKSLYQYAQDYLDVNLNDIIKKRQKDFFIVFRSHIAQRLGPHVADGAVKQLEKYYFASTADHHGPVVHPFFLNSNLIIASAYDANPDPLLRYVVVLSCANISLNNSSFPRGLLYTTGVKNRLDMRRLSFLPSTAHSSAVHNFRPYTRGEVQKVQLVIKQRQQEGGLTPDVAEKLTCLIDEVYNQPSVFDCVNYSDQVVVTNFSLWKKMLQNNRHQFPDLLYVEQEALTKELLLSYHLDQQTSIGSLLFDADAEHFMNKYFEGIMGAYSRKEKWGTYLFWGVHKEKNHRAHLWKEGNYLVSDDGSIRVELTPVAIRHGLEQNEIIPGMMLIFATLSFYYGLKCLGGPNQVNYLTLLKDAYLAMCRDRGDMESMSACERVQTKEFVEGPTVAFIKGAAGVVAPAAGVDLSLYHNEHTWDTIVSLTRNITLEEAFCPRLPDYYPVMYPEVERIPALSTLTTEQITECTGLDKKLYPCVTI